MFAIAAKGTHSIFLSLSIIVLHKYSGEQTRFFKDVDDDQTVVDALYRDTMCRDGFSCSRGGYRHRDAIGKTRSRRRTTMICSVAMVSPFCCNQLKAERWSRNLFRTTLNTIAFGKFGCGTDHGFYLYIALRTHTQCEGTVPKMHSGSVYVFKMSSSGDASSWTQVAKPHSQR